MRLNYNITFLILLSISFLQAIAQPPERTDTAYISIEGGGNTRNNVVREPKNNSNDIIIVGGYVNIGLTSKFMANSHKIYYKAYFNNSGKKEDPKDRQNKTDLGPQSSPIYLNVNKSFCIEILDQQTDSLISSYCIRRLRIIPTIILKKDSSQYEKPIPIDFSSNNPSEISLIANEEIEIISTPLQGYESLEVEYILLNLKTKKTKLTNYKNGFGVLKLSPNTEYEFRVHYALQPESDGIVYIKVKPYWYKSTVAFVFLGLILAIILFSLILAFYKSKISKSRKEQEKLEAAAIRLQSLLNPHFTFNALSSIQGLMNTGRIEEASQYLQEFSSLLRKTLSKSKQVYNSLDQEIEMMDIYLKLESLRFKFSYSIEVSSSINPSIIEIPTLLLQPLIENAVKHGVSGLGEKGIINILCREKNDHSNTLEIVIKDNGKSLDKPLLEGYGLSLTKERIEAINTIKKGQPISFEFSSADGTEVILHFKNYLNN